MNKMIATDVDETVLQCNHELQQFITDTLGYGPHHDLHENYDIGLSYGIGENLVRRLIQAFWESDLMGCLEPLPCASEVLPRLHGQGYRFTAVSACADDPKTIKKRNANLTNAFGFEFEAVHCVYHQPKNIVLSQYEPSIWVEDHFQNAVLGAELGYRTFLIDRPYNRGLEYPGVVRVGDWWEIEGLLLDD